MAMTLSRSANYKFPFHTLTWKIVVCLVIFLVLLYAQETKNKPVPVANRTAPITLMLYSSSTHRRKNKMQNILSGLIAPMIHIGSEQLKSIRFELTQVLEEYRETKYLPRKKKKKRRKELQSKYVLLKWKEQMYDCYDIFL